MTKDKMERTIERMLILLKKEWEQSGPTVMVLPVDRLSVAQLSRYVQETVSAIDEDLEWYEYTFAQTLKATRKSYILLRFLKKLLSANQWMNSHESDSAILELDSEEYAAYKKAIAYYKNEKEI